MTKLHLLIIYVFWIYQKKVTVTTAVSILSQLGAIPIETLHVITGKILKDVYIQRTGRKKDMLTGNARFEINKAKYLTSNPLTLIVNLIYSFGRAKGRFPN